MPSSKVILATQPPLFDGDKSKWNNFYDSVTTYIAAYDTDFDTEKKKIWFTISFLRKENGGDCTASDWVRNWKKRSLNNAVLPATYTFNALIRELESSFKDHNLAQIAHAKLTSTHQGKATLTEFFQRFELLAEQAGYSPNDTNTTYHAFLIELLEGLINQEIVGQMYVGGMALPTTYQAFKERLTQIDANRQRGKIRGTRQVFHTIHTLASSPNHPPQPITQGTVPNLAKSLADGPVPMDVDVDKQGQRGRPYRCYNCGKFGHLKKDCPDPPKRKFNLRELVSEIEAEDADSEILQQLAEKLREQGF